ncbi:hypothetical protein [Novosphingobium sp. Chol11]|uniref:hypothetical protein n=1 Tax=Novosphingobium sp. Chol11 TaxID=1385763 RepID=UPI0025D204DF|nr:hypothetical protein [Novosphingobium sp. Chol11]
MAFNRTVSLIVALVLGFAAATAAAQDDGTCRNGLFPAQNPEFGRSKVQGTGRAYFHYDMDGCPRLSASCRRGYVVPGDTVVTGRTIGAFICAYFPSKGGGTAGWVEASRLRALPVNARPPLAAWLGRWSDEGNPALRITQTKSGVLQIAGDAFWPGPVRQKDWPSGWPHLGQIGGELKLRGNRAHYDDGTCTVDLVALGDVLIGLDNESCGGMNVRFNGVYRLRRR